MYYIYSRTGKLLDTVDTQEKAERLLGVWFNVAYVIRASDNKVVAERKEVKE